MGTEPSLFGGRFAVLQSEARRRGGMSIVYPCADLANGGQRVAVKVIRPEPEWDHLEHLIYEREMNVRELVHPNIVRLVDVGDDSDGKRFLAYEWVEEDLKSWIARQDELGADDFVETVGLPLLRAVSLAHERQIVHRDVKPSNILMTPSGMPKLADFGISKVKYRLAETSETMAAFSSKPFTPPADDSQSGYTRDVFGFGVVMLWSLAGFRVTDYSDFDAALDSIDASPKLIDLLTRCVSLEQQDRPKNAVQLLAELEEMQARRQHHWVKREPIFFRVKPHASPRIAESAGVAASEVPAFIEEQLSEGAALRLLEADPLKARHPNERQAFAYGSSWSFRLVFLPDSPWVDIVGAQDVGEGDCDARRDRHFVASEWDFCGSGPMDHNVAIQGIERLLDAIEVHDSDRATSRLEREELRLFEQWRRQLDAREAAESHREGRVKYEHVSVSGQRARFVIRSDTESFALEQRRSVLDDQGRRVALGEVEWIDGKQVDLYLEQESNVPLPRTGQLAIDTVAAREKLRRERNALSALRFSGPELRRSDLAGLILHPSEVAELTPVEEMEWVNPDLDESKRSAIRGALGCTDFFLVQGPPGTGKTTFIAELVAQEVRRNPEVRILLASQTHVALDNALEGIRALEGPSLRLLRLGNINAGKIAESVADLTLEHRLDAWREGVRQSSIQYLEAAARDEGADLSLLKAALSMRQLARVLERAAEVREEIEKLEVAPRSDDSAKDESQQAEESQLAHGDLGKLRRLRSQLDRDARHLRESRTLAIRLKAVPSHDAHSVQMMSEELLREATGSDRLTRLVSLQASWLERLGRGPEFQAALLAASQVVAGTCVGMARARGIDEVPFDLCIVDEASKAAATETLIPLIRANRWVLVGDEKQLPPFLEEALRDRSVIEEFGLDTEETRQTLFGRLADPHALPPQNSITLSTQYRMVPEIGNLISECFYGGSLKSYASRPPWDLSGWQPSVVTWFNTETLPGHHEQRRGDDAPSFVNPVEARAVIRHLQRLDFLLSRSNDARPVKVLILAPYRLQVEQISRQVDGLRRQSERLHVEVGTVDAVQGREADLLIFSAVRSNAGTRLGFVSDIARANVALSRGRYSLTIFGDMGFFDRASSPLRDVLSYIRRHPKDCSVKELSE